MGYTSTHLNTENIHNHFIINSVSFRTGRKFENHISDHYKLREISDAICKERGKSIIENAPFYGGEKKAYWLHKEGEKTHKDILKDDIEYCLTYSSKWEEFMRQLLGLGYTVDYSRMTVKAKDWERGIRLSSLGYTVEIIQIRLDENFRNPYFRFEWNSHLPYKPRKFLLEQEMKRLSFIIEHSKKPEVVFVDTMFLLLVTIIRIVTEVADAMLLSPDLRYAAKDFKQYVADYNFLTDNGIHTTEDLSQSINETKIKIAELEEKRRKTDNKKRRASTPEEKELYKARRREITEEITPLRNRLKQAEKIFEKSPHIYELLQKEDRLERQAIKKLERTR